MSEYPTITIKDERPNIIISPGTQGPAGPQNVFVGPDNPNLEMAGMWLQTFPNGDMTLWVEDGEAV